MMDSLFLELLQLSLETKDSLSRAPSAEEWRRFFKEAQRQAVVALMAGGLYRIPNTYIAPEDVLVQWIGRAQKLERLYALHCMRAKELTALFRDAGYVSCVLKGVAMARYYPSPSSRQLGDIDLWVFGDRREITSQVLNNYNIREIRWHHTDVDFFDDVKTEIHFHATWLFNPIRNGKLQCFLDSYKDVVRHSVPSENGFVAPMASFDAVYSLVHSFHHLLETGIGLRHVVDYFYIVRALDCEERASVVHVIENIGLKPFLGAMMWVLQDVCGMALSDLLCEPNEREGRFLLDEVLRGGNFGHYRRDNHQWNSFARFITLMQHYPGEIIWMYPWKIWHRHWRNSHRG